MPVAPRPDGGSQPVGSSDGGKKRRSKSRPTTKRRNERQKLKERYAKAREDAQLAGMIPTEPQGALKPERVDPSVQGCQPLSHLVSQAIKRGWAVEDQKKPSLVQEMVDIVMSADMPVKAKIAAFNALRQADESQWTRENPSPSVNGKGGASAIAISVQTNISAVDLMQRMMADGSIRLDQIIGVANGTTNTTPNPLAITGGAGDSGLAGEVETSPAPPDGQPEVDERLVDSEQ